MRSRTAVIAGLASLAIAGAAFAEAKRDVHLVNLLLPDGSIGQLRYVGDTPPRIVMVPTPVAFARAPFADFERIEAAMDERMDAMFRQADLLARSGAAASEPGIAAAVGQQLPAGTIHYSYVSTTSSDGKTCSRSVQLTSLGAGQQPRLVSHDAGDCSALAVPVTQATQPAPAAPAPKVIPAKLDSPPQPAGAATRT